MSNPDAITKKKLAYLRPVYHEHLDSGKLRAVTIKYTIHGKQIAILISYDVPPQYDQGDASLPGQYLNRLGESSWSFMGEPTTEDTIKMTTAIREELMLVAHKACEELLMEIAGPATPNPFSEAAIASNEHPAIKPEAMKHSDLPKTLHEYFYSDALVVQLVSEGGKLKGVRRNDIHPPANWPACSALTLLEEKAKTQVPLYTPRQIQILKDSLMAYSTFRVATPDGQVAHCLLPQWDNICFQREYGVLRKLLDAGCTTPTLRVPQLRGLVRSDIEYDDDGIIAILKDHIDTERRDFSLHLAPPLHSGEEINMRSSPNSLDPNYSNPLPMPEIAASRREKWIAQIVSTVRQLHDLDIVWGSACTGNILLDRNDDLWVTDFSGAMPSDWSDRKLLCTKEGDLKNLARIVDEIAGRRRALRSDVTPPEDQVWAGPNKIKPSL
jgi:hypothetical protein